MEDGDGFRAPKSLALACAESSQSRRRPFDLILRSRRIRTEDAVRTNSRGKLLPFCTSHAQSLTAIFQVRPGNLAHVKE